MSTLISIILVLIIAGVIMWLINNFIPMASPIKTLLNVVVLILLILWILQIFGVFHFRV